MENLIAKCRFYKGEENCPEEITKAGNQMFWWWEYKWVEQFGGEFEDKNEYVGSQLTDFEKDDGVPLSFKKLLFNRFIQDSSLTFAVEPFKKWYNDYYNPGV